MSGATQFIFRGSATMLTPEIAKNGEIRVKSKLHSLAHSKYAFAIIIFC
jgi:hypothetical protein